MVCWNGSKMSRRCDGSIPAPVSVTTKRMRSCSPPASSASAGRAAGPAPPPPAAGSRRASRRTSPRAVNFTALPSRLINTCRTFRSSVQTSAGTAASTSTRNRSPLDSARGRTMSATARRAWPRSQASMVVWSRPASIRERSSTSLTSDRSCSPQLSMPSRHSFWAGVSDGSAWRICTYPSTPLRGVRSSWLMLARNSVLARVAVSAARRDASAAARAWRSSSSVSFCRVTSRLVTTTPRTAGSCNRFRPRASNTRYAPSARRSRKTTASSRPGSDNTFASAGGRRGGRRGGGGRNNSSPAAPPAGRPGRARTPR